MRLLTMQLNSITVMDVFAFGGAAVGIIAAMVQFANGQIPFTSAFALVFLSAGVLYPMRAWPRFSDYGYERHGGSREDVRHP